MKSSATIPVLMLLLFGVPAMGDTDSGAGDKSAPVLEIQRPWILAPGKDATDVLSVKGYANFRNTGASSVRITRASSRQFRWVMIQRATLQDGQPRRTVVGDFTILPEATVTMSDAGYRFAFLGPVKPVAAGAKIDVELEFRDRPPVKVAFPVLASAPAPNPPR